jgi:hypothetical protein
MLPAVRTNEEWEAVGIRSSPAATGIPMTEEQVEDLPAAG